MRKQVVRLCFLALVMTVGLGGLAAAQQPAASQPPAAQPPAAQPPSGGQQPREMPPVLVLYREEVKPGRGAAHAANEAGWADAFVKAGHPETWLGMTSIAGPSEAWFASAAGLL